MDHGHVAAVSGEETMTKAQLEKAGHRWKTIATIKIKIQVASRAACWRAVSSIDSTVPMPSEAAEPAPLLFSGRKFKGIAHIRRLQAQ